MLRPDGMYVGARYDPDDARTEEPETGSALSRDQPESQQASIPSSQPSTSQSSAGVVPLTGGQPTSNVAVDPSESTPPASAWSTQVAPAVARPPHPEPLPDNHEDDGEYDDEPEGVGIDDFLRVNSSRAGLHTGIRDAPAAGGHLSRYSDNTLFLVVDGRKYLKASVVTIILTAKRSRKVTMRTLRARGVTIEDLRGDDKSRLNLPDNAGEDLVKCGDLCACLVRLEGIICLAVVEIVEFALEGERRTGGVARLSAVEFKDLEKRDSKIQVLVQALKLRPLSDLSDTATDTVWLWEHAYAQIEALSGTTRRHYTFHISSFLLYPLAPEIVPVPGANQGNFSLQPTSQNPDRTTTWSLLQSQLDETLDVAWDALRPETEDIISNIEELPTLKLSNGLPYQNSTGKLNVLTRYINRLTGSRYFSHRTRYAAASPCREADESKAEAHLLLVSQGGAFPRDAPPCREAHSVVYEGRSR